MRLLLVAVLLLAACRPTTPITSADPPTAPVPVRWSLNDSPRPDGHRLRLYGGTLGAIPARLRVLDAAGAELAVIAANFSPGQGFCGDTAGVAGAEVPLSDAEASQFRSGWPAGYVVEAEVAGQWRATTLTSAGCTTHD